MEKNNHAWLNTWFTGFAWFWKIPGPEFAGRGPEFAGPGPEFAGLGFWGRAQIGFLQKSCITEGNHAWLNIIQTPKKR